MPSTACRNRRPVRRSVSSSVLGQSHDAAHLAVGPDVGREGRADLDRRGALPLDLGLEGHGPPLEDRADVWAHPGIALLADDFTHRAPGHLTARPEVLGLVEAVAEDVALVGVDVHQRRRNGVEHEA